MTDVKISELTSTTFSQVDGTLELPINVGGATQRIDRDTFFGIYKSGTISANNTITIQAGTFINFMIFKWISGSITIRVGTDSGEDDIISDFVLSSGVQSQLANHYYENTSGLYVSFTGTGTFSYITQLIQDS